MTAPSSVAPSSRSDRTRRAVLDATAALLAEGGLTSATVDAVRDRSGVSKTTLYKHWPNRLHLAIDAFAERLASATPFPDTGSVRSDLTEQLRSVIAFYGSPVGGIFTQLLTASLHDPGAAARLQERLLVSRRAGIEHLWERAVRRGEVRAEVDPDLATDLIFGPVMWRLLSGRAPLHESDAGAVADAVLTGLLAPRTSA